MPTRDLRFAMDEKGIKALAETLVGQTMSYWEDNHLRQGRVTRAEVKRDRYGNPYLEVDLEEAGGEPASAGAPEPTT